MTMHSLLAPRDVLPDSAGIRAAGPTWTKSSVAAGKGKGDAAVTDRSTLTSVPCGLKPSGRLAIIGERVHGAHLSGTVTDPDRQPGPKRHQGVPFPRGRTSSTTRTRPGLAKCLTKTRGKLRGRPHKGAGLHRDRPGAGRNTWRT